MNADWKALANSEQCNCGRSCPSKRNERFSRAILPPVDPSPDLPPAEEVRYELEAQRWQDAGAVPKERATDRVVGTNVARETSLQLTAAVNGGYELAISFRAARPPTPSRDGVDTDSNGIIFWLLGIPEAPWICRGRSVLAGPENLPEPKFRRVC